MKRNSSQVSIPYGSQRINFEIGSHHIAGIVSPELLPRKFDVVKVILDSLSNPIGMSDFEYVLNGVKTVTILVDDITRLTPTKLIISILLEKLSDYGVRLNAIRVVIASGTHRPMTLSEKIEKLGSDIVHQMQIIDHRYRDYQDLAYLGKTNK